LQKRALSAFSSPQSLQAITGRVYVGCGLAARLVPGYVP
jgi:hypothetical protein